MRTAVISDIHANLEALQAVLADIQKNGVEAIYALGDVVGYGADPKACLELVMARCAVCVRGNHEQALLQPERVLDMSAPAALAITWTRDVLGSAEVQALADWPLVQTGGDARLVHASPRAPLAFEYVRGRLDCEDNFRFFPEKICFLGHTHVPWVAEEIVPGTLRWLGDDQVDLDPQCRYLINVGSVGQPRDGNPAARWVMVEDQPARITFCSVSYDVASAQAKIRLAGLPELLAERLATGS